jgi:hypothetical protein
MESHEGWPADTIGLEALDDRLKTPHFLNCSAKGQQVYSQEDEDMQVATKHQLPIVGQRHCKVHWRRVRPNPSLKPSPNGGPPGPGHRYGVHCLWPGPGVPPLGPA